MFKVLMLITTISFNLFAGTIEGTVSYAGKNRSAKPKDGFRSNLWLFS